MDRWPGDLLARLEDPQINMREAAAYLMLLPRDEQQFVLDHPLSQRMRLESAVDYLREQYVYCFNRHLPNEWAEDSTSRARYRAVLAARGGASGPDEELLTHLVEHRSTQADARAWELVSQALDRLRTPWKPPTLR
jgi:hypothetical protein